MKIHFITFANGKSRINNYNYARTQFLLNDSIENHTSYPVVFHTHNLETIKSKPWFVLLDELKKINSPYRRDGYFVAYKPLLIRDVYRQMDDGDVLYYADSSSYFPIGFMDNIDRMINYTLMNGHICGSFGNSLANIEGMCCSSMDAWRYIWNDCPDIEYCLFKQHVLNSWFSFAKNDMSEQFINEWADLTINGKIGDKPIITLHHTVDQAIFNILVYKHKMKCFHNKTRHEANKNHNLIHQTLNAETQDIAKWFKNPLAI